MSAEPPLRGEIRWALVPYVAQAPYAVVGAPDATTFADVVRQIRDGGPRSAVDLTLRTVLRPVLLVHGWESATHGSYVVLRTRRLSVLSPASQAAVRSGAANGLVLLDGATDGHERVAMVAGLARVHGTAIEPWVAGRVTSETMRRVDERIVDRLGLELDRPVQRGISRVLSRVGLA